MRRARDGDIITIVEAAYRVDGTLQAWLDGVLEAASASLDVGAGMTALVYDAANPARMKLLASSQHQPLAPMTHEAAAYIVETADADFVRASWRSLACAVSSSIPGVERQPGWAELRAMGVADTLCVNGVDASGVGCELVVYQRRPIRPDARTQRRWSRVAAHLSSGLRLHRRLASSPATRNVTVGADAVLSASGKVQHADGDAKVAAARAALAAATVAVDRARGSPRRREPDEALGWWTGLVSARWSLVDHFDSDGKHYVVARRNAPEASGLDVLSERERQVAASASLGRSNKVIAYELGIADSTVRVLLARAAAKLGVPSRAELVRVVARALEAKDGS